MFMFIQVELIIKLCHYAQEGFIALQLTVTTICCSSYLFHFIADLMRAHTQT